MCSKLNGMLLILGNLAKEHGKKDRLCSVREEMTQIMKDMEILREVSIYTKVR